MAEESRPSTDEQIQNHKMAETTHHNHKHHHLNEDTNRRRTRYYDPKNRRRSLSACIVIFLLLAGITALILWLVYRPQDPQFTVTNAAVYALNTTTATSPPLLSAALQFTIITRNPNERVSIFYHRLSAFVTFRNQMITPPVILPPLYHERRSTVVISPVLGGGGGTGVPVSEEVLNGLVMDEGYGVVGLRLVLLGRLRYKAGAIWTRRYGISVRCEVLLGSKNGFVGQVPLLPSPPCKVRT